MGQIFIQPETNKNPITTIGRMIGICYGSDVSDDAKNYKRGLNCIKAGHGRVLEFAEVYLSIQGYSARVIREWYTHIGGAPTRVQESTRYINYQNFDYIIPPSISRNESTSIVYETCMDNISQAVTTLMEHYDIPKEDAANLLPLGMTTGICCKHNARNLMNMFEQRSCARAYWEYRDDIMKTLYQELHNYSEEWAVLCELIFKCKCDKCGYCLEEYSCGRYPKLDE